MKSISTISNFAYFIIGSKYIFGSNFLLSSNLSTKQSIISPYYQKGTLIVRTFYRTNHFEVLCHPHNIYQKCFLFIIILNSIFITMLVLVLITISIISRGKAMSGSSSIIFKCFDIAYRTILGKCS